LLHKDEARCLLPRLFPFVSYVHPSPAQPYFQGVHLFSTSATRLAIKESAASRLRHLFLIAEVDTFTTCCHLIATPTHRALLTIDILSFLYCVKESVSNFVGRFINMGTSGGFRVERDRL
jgi:hypothetical protein